MKFLIFLLLHINIADAGFPPTTTKASGDATNVTTFNFDFPYFAVTRTGITTNFNLLGVQGGGTGASTLTSGYILLGNNNAPVTLVGPGSSGNILTSNGSTWTSAPPATSGTVTSFTTSTGLLGGPISTTGTISVDVGTAANKILQLTTTDQIPAVDGNLVTNVNAVKLQTRNVSAAAPIGGQVLGWNTTNSDWEPTFASSGTVTSVGLTVPTFLSVAGSPITSSGTLTVTLSGTALPVANGGTGTTTGSITGTGALTLAAGSGNNNVIVSPTGTGSVLLTPKVGIGTNTPLANLDVEGTGSVILNAGNVGIGTTNPIYPLDTAGIGRFGATGSLGIPVNGQADLFLGQGSTVSGSNTYMLLGRTAATGGTVYIQGFQTSGSPISILLNSAGGDIGIGTTTPHAILDVNGTGTLSAIIVPRDSTANRPTTAINGMIRYNNTSNALEGYVNSSWQSFSTGAGSGTVTSIATVTGILGGPITTTGTLSVDVGTAANKIVQLTPSDFLPAVDGNLLTNLNAIRIQGNPISNVTPTSGQVLTWNSSVSQWQALSAPPPTKQLFTTTGSTTGYVFTVSGISVAPTAGATYTNNSQTYTVVGITNSNTLLWTSHSGSTSTTGSTLTKTGGTGDASITFTASATQVLGTYSLPVGTNWLKVTLIGGGGGGGGIATASVSAGGGGGGGSGGTCIKWISSPSSGSPTYYYTVGPTGGGGSAGANDGTAGGFSGFGSGSTFYVAFGGLGGRGGTAQTTPVLYLGSSGQGGGGSVTGCDVNSPGNPGGYGIILTATSAAGGNGGSSSFGGGALYSSATGTGTNGGGYGAGASGGVVVNGSASAAGGAGTAGLVLSEEFSQ